VSQYIAIMDAPDGKRHRCPFYAESMEHAQLRSKTIRNRSEISLLAQEHNVTEQQASVLLHEEGHFIKIVSVEEVTEPA
jgi:hypothetical protein